MTVPAIHSTLCPDALRGVIAESYGTGAVTRCRLLKRGWNDTYDVHTDEGRYVLRVYRSLRTPNNVRYELHFLEHVRGRGVPVAMPVRSRDGALSVGLHAPEGSRCAALFEYAEGEKAEFANPDEMYRFGATAAALHEAADSYVAPNDRTTLTVPEMLHEPVRAVEPYLVDRHDDATYLRHLANRLHERLEALSGPAADFGPCHGDLHTANVHSAAGSLTLLDFDFCGPCYRAYDLATFGGVAKMKQARTPWEAFLHGYNDRRPLSGQDLALIPIFVVVRFIWLVGIRLSRSPEAGEAWIGNYLDTWFTTLHRAAAVLDGDGPATLDDAVRMVGESSRPRKLLTRLMSR